MKDIKLLACGSDRRVIATPPERNEKGIDRYLGRICMLHEQTAYERRHSLCGSLEIGAHDDCVFHFMLKPKNLRGKPSSDESQRNPGSALWAIVTTLIKVIPDGESVRGVALHVQCTRYLRLR
jgi:hypothetical protein